MKKKIAVYCRVSTNDKQEKGLDSQKHSLKQYCKRHNIPIKSCVLYEDRMTGSKLDRPRFNKLQKDIFAGKVDTVIVWKLNRISRSLQDGINVLCNWLKEDVRVISVTEQFDFEGALGQMIASFLFALAQLGREELREGIKRGLTAAKARGVKLGRPHSNLIEKIVPLLKEGHTVAEVAKKLGRTRQGIYDCLRREGVNRNEL